MQTGISLRIVSDFDRALWSLPPPSAKRWLSRIDGTKILQVLYHFEHNPQSWREWQRIAAIKIQMQQIMPHIEFTEYELIEGIERVYRVTELGQHFPKFIKFHKPLYPSSKDEFMRSLTIYAQRLHYEEQLHYEAVLAMALHFNSKGGYGYSFRELNRKARAVMELNRSKWRVKLKSDELKEAHVKGANTTNEIKRKKSNAKRDEAVELRKSGMILNDIATKLEVSLRTVKSWKLPKC